MLPQIWLYAYWNKYYNAQMKLYRAAIIQHNARNYVTALYANQISGKQLQIYTANILIFKSPSISSNRAVS